MSGRGSCSPPSDMDVEVGRGFQADHGRPGSSNAPEGSERNEPVSTTTSSASTASRQLKFGMERILSEEISPSRHVAHAAEPSAAGSCGTAPCSECVSSLLRCCRLGPGGPGPYSPYHGPYYNPVHAPRPIRPYNNLLVSDGIHISSAERNNSSSTGNKRKRSWSRAVFSNLQRKGLEKRFQLQKYITKPDRRQLAATLGLTDAQVKVWFQNRRMKWRHSKEAKQENNISRNVGKEEQGRPDSTQDPDIDVQTVDS